MGSKYWGEERQPDAVYSVYLKKVRYVSPTIQKGNSLTKRGNDQNNKGNDQTNDTLDAAFDDADYLQWETIRERVIKAGTIRKLVESLVDHDGQLDSRQFNVFFATYRAFTSTENVLQLIIAWYEKMSLKSDSLKQQFEPHARRAIKSIIVCWLDMYPEDFYKPFQTNNCEFQIIEKLINFSKAENLQDLKHKAKNLRKVLKNIQQNGGLIAQIPSIAAISFAITGYDPNQPCTSETSNANFQNKLFDNEQFSDAQLRSQMFDVECENALQIAEQLTFWDALLFKGLKPYQCQGSIWGKRKKLGQEAVYSVRATIDQFNSLSQRVITSILLPDCQPNFRAQIIMKWIRIAKELRLLNNFSSLKAVLSSLQSQSIFRLENVWSFVSKDSMAQFKELTSLYDGNLSDKQLPGTCKIPEILPKDSNYRRTKSDINFASEPQGTVPYLGSFLTELAMIDQALPDNTEDGLVNFDKRRQEFEVLAKLRLYQSTACVYSIDMDQSFCVWFNFLPAFDEKRCFIRSLEILSDGNTEQSTPDILRKQGSDSGIQQMTKINSLSKLFSGLGYFTTSKELAFISGNSSFYENRQKKQNSDDSSVDRSDGLINTEKPARSQRSRSQGAKKDTRCKQNTMKESYYNPNYQRISSSSERNNCSEFTRTGSRLIGSEFNPLNSINLISLHQKQTKGHDCDNVDFVSYSTHTSGVSSVELVNPSLNHEPILIAARENNAKFYDLRDIHTPTSSNSHSEMLERLKHFQKSTSSSSSRSSLGTAIIQKRKEFRGNSPSSISVSNCPKKEENFHLIRVGLDQSLQIENHTVTTTNYKCIKVVNGDRMPQVIQRILEKHMMDPNESPNYCLIQLLPDGGEFRFPDHCNPFYAVAPDPTSPMLNCLLRKRVDCCTQPNTTPDENEFARDGKKKSKQKRNIEQRVSMLRWSSGFL